MKVSSVKVSTAQVAVYNTIRRDHETASRLYCTAISILGLFHVLLVRICPRMLAMLAIIADSAKLANWDKRTPSGLWQFAGDFFWAPQCCLSPGRRGLNSQILWDLWYSSVLSNANIQLSLARFSRARST